MFQVNEMYTFLCPYLVIVVRIAFDRVLKQMTYFTSDIYVSARVNKYKIDANQELIAIGKLLFWFQVSNYVCYYFLKHT